ncbi:MAG: CRISPR-associated protein Cas6, partial [Bacteroidota bacterium]
MIKGILVKGGNKEWIDYSLYNFSGLKGQTKVSRKGLHFYSARITLVISSPNKGFVDYLLTNLFSFDQMDLGNMVIQPEGVELEEEVKFSESMKFICISPLVILNSSFND